MIYFRVVQGGIEVASVSSADRADAWQGIKHYALQYAEEGPLEIQEKRGKRWVNKVIWKVWPSDEAPR